MKIIQDTAAAGTDAVDGHRQVREYAGPIDPLIELARVCWLFPQLHDDDVAEMVRLPPLEIRVRQLRLLVDAYGLSPLQISLTKTWIIRADCGSRGL